MTIWFDEDCMYVQKGSGAPKRFLKNNIYGFYAYNYETQAATLKTSKIYFRFCLTIGKDIYLNDVEYKNKYDDIKGSNLKKFLKSAQTEFRVGYHTGLKYDATGEYYRASLLNYALGGDFNSRLNLNLREDKGWTYGARSSFSGDEYDGDFKFSSGIKAEATDSALGEVVKEIRNYAANGITEDELAFMKNAIGQRDARAYETSIQKAGFIRMILDYNLPANYTATQAKILQNMTKKEMDGLIKKHISADRLNMLLVGDKAKILPGLQKMGYKIIELDAEGKPVGKKAF